MRESEIPLSNLDASIQFEGDYCEPIRYDAARRMLRYRGTMSHASFVHLQALSRDRLYQRALEQLFVASAMPPEPSMQAGKWLAIGGLSTAVVVGVAGAWFVMGGRSEPTAPPLENVASAGERAGNDSSAVPAAKSPQDVGKGNPQSPSTQY
jgi:hypothetical protein